MTEFVKRLEQAILSFKYANEDFRKGECIVALIPYGAYPLARRDIHTYMNGLNSYVFDRPASIDGAELRANSFTLMGVTCHCIRADVQKEIISKSKLAPSEVKAAVSA